MLELPGPSAFPDPVTLFFTPPSVKRLADVAVSPRSPVLRVWLPSRRCQPYKTLGSLFQLPTLLGFALQSFPPTDRSKKGFPFFSPPLHFFRKPKWPVAGAPTVLSRSVSRASRHPQRFSSGRDLCSPELFDLLGAPSTWPTFKASRFKSSLLLLCISPGYPDKNPELQGLSTKRPGDLPP